LATLLAIGYPEQGTAGQAAEELRRLHHDLLVAHDAIAVITRDAQGEYVVITSHHPVVNDASWGMFWGPLFGLVFFVPVFGTAIGAGLGGLFGKIERSGINRAFQQQARDMVRPGTSALFVLTGQVDADAVLAALARFGGTPLRFPLTATQAADLQEAIHGRLSASV
jgi:uncharacterized membrane protein